MKDFMVDGEPRSKSIGFDATSRGNLVVTVGVLVSRFQEASLLEDFYQTIYEYDYEPFRTKSRDLSLPPEKVHTLLERCDGDIGICIHQDSAKLAYAEAVHSAILTDELSVSPDETIAIVDGDRGRAEQLFRAISAIGSEPPSVANCVQSELYYPHQLLADLVAGAIADTLIEDPDRLSSGEINGPIQVVNTTKSRTGRWGQGYSTVARNEGTVQRSTYEQRYAESVRERVNCWFSGYMGEANAPSPRSDGIRPVVGRLSDMDCEGVATWLAEQ